MIKLIMAFLSGLLPHRKPKDFHCQGEVDLCDSCVDEARELWTEMNK